MKLSELTVNENGIRLRRTNPNPLSAQQKFYISLSAIFSLAVCVLILAFFSLLQ